MLGSETGTIGKLIAERADLERVRNQMTMLQVKWIADLEEQATFYQQTSEKLARIAKFLLQTEPTATIGTEYANVVNIWRDIVDNTREVVASHYAWSVPQLPDFPEQLLAKLGNRPEALQYASACVEAKAFRTSLQKKVGDRLEESINLHYRVLLQSGEIRSQLLNMLLKQGDKSPLAISVALLQDVRREFAIVPYRWTATFYLRSLEARTRLSQGWQGLVETAADLGLLAVFLLIPWGIWLGSKKQGTTEYALFNAMKKMIEIRKETSSFADFNNRELVDVDNEHLLCFIRFNHQRPSERVLVVANFDADSQFLDLYLLRSRGIDPYGQFIDLFSGGKPTQYDRRIVLQGFQFYWLTEI